MSDDFASKVAAQVLVELFKESVKGVKELASLLLETNRGKDPLGRAAQEYVKGIHRKYNVMRIFGMADPKPLESVYTRVNLLRRVTATRRETVEELTELFSRERRFGEVQDTRSGIEVVNSIERLILLGKPGSGKTTFMKYVALNSLNEKLSRQLTPVFISLKDLSDSGKSLLDAIAAEFAQFGIDHASAFANNLMKQGRCRLLLDGLDEVSDVRRDTIIREITNLSDSYPSVQLLVTCRVAAYNYSFEAFTAAEMADFGEDQIRSFMANWWRDNTQLAEQCWETICRVHGLREIAATPLLLTLLCLAFEDTLDISANRAELYKDAIDALLKKWDSTRSIRRQEVYRDLTPKRKEDLFCALAAQSFEREQYFFPREDLEASIGGILRKFTAADEVDLRELSHATLESIKAHHGLIVERSKDIHSFSHLTFQEYFCARYISLHGEESQAALVRNYFTDVRWREIVVLVACLLADAEHYIVQILRTMQGLGFSGGPLSRAARLTGSSREQVALASDGTPETLTIRPHARGTHLSMVVRDLGGRTAEAEDALRSARRRTLTHKERLIQVQAYAIAASLFPHLSLAPPSPEVNRQPVIALLSDGRILRVNPPIREVEDDLLRYVGTQFHILFHHVVEEHGSFRSEGLERLEDRPMFRLIRETLDEFRSSRGLEDLCNLCALLVRQPRKDSGQVQPPIDPASALSVVRRLFPDETEFLTEAGLYNGFWPGPMLASFANMESHVRKGAEADVSVTELFVRDLDKLFLFRGKPDACFPTGHATQVHAPRERRYREICNLLRGPLHLVADRATRTELVEAFVEDSELVIRRLSSSVRLEEDEWRQIRRDLRAFADRSLTSPFATRITAAETLLEILKCPIVVRREVRAAALETILSVAPDTPEPDHHPPEPRRARA